VIAVDCKLSNFEFSEINLFADSFKKCYICESKMRDLNSCHAILADHSDNANDGKILICNDCYNTHELESCVINPRKEDPERLIYFFVSLNSETDEELRIANRRYTIKIEPKKQVPDSYVENTVKIINATIDKHRFLIEEKLRKKESLWRSKIIPSGEMDFDYNYYIHREIEYMALNMSLHKNLYAKHLKFVIAKKRVKIKVDVSVIKSGENNEEPTST